jgi:nicotinamide mononucleotide transporter
MRFLYFFVLILATQNTLGTTFFISPNGSDWAGNGTKNAPWLTLARATNAVQKAGDVIHVLPGEYTESVSSRLFVGVSLEGEGSNCIIKSTLSQQFVPIIIAASPEGTNGSQSISFLKFDGSKQTTSWAIGITGRSNFSVHDCEFIDFDESAISFSGIEGAVAPGAPKIYATGNKFFNNQINNCAKYEGYGRGALQFGGQEGMLIYNNTIKQLSRGFAQNGYPIKMANEGYTRGCKIYNNKLYKIPYKGNFGGEDGWNFAIELWNVEGMEIYGNTIQGALDVANCGPGKYAYGLYVHDNSFTQPTIPEKYEDGIILETDQHKIIIRKNTFTNVTTGIVFSPHDYGNGLGIHVDDIKIDSNTFKNLGIIDGGQGFGIRWNNTEFNPVTVVTNVFITNNKFIAEKAPNAAVNGVQLPGFQGPVKAKNIQVINNYIQGFQYAPIYAKPASGVDTVVISGNNFVGNGNNNEPRFDEGVPNKIILKKNEKSYTALAPKPSFNFKNEVVRPLYDNLKNTTLVEYIAVLSGIMSVWFSRKENIYVYPVGLISTIIYIFLSIDASLFGEASVNLYYTIMSIYGWILWSKRDKRQHRIVRVTHSTKKELLMQFVFFAVIYISIFAALTLLKENFAPGAIPWADAFASATAFTGMWLMTKKKVESWYWWIATNIASIPLYFTKHFVLTSVYYAILLVMAYLGLKEWQKRAKTTRRAH